ncbi:MULTISPECIES: TauD/TfdA family dioxygenase [unclassified Saccharibacter]|uniref:TauD/TfdA dioxygenase family protein n=1 Tax=unclassified Saccharibacter TaxID=2648722 RepID=UPI0013287A8C|nr:MULTISPECIES: TauD/TfdA family dioxygenase [unclassified Saccharibacter]MXV35245.1 TauD/TfdA family dioxygenase [Saccharibacter sp. EH611]MXV57208.1 TauD/TfdA family dioxygenase [Saccharibacter sp. EH70]MXV64931.1 TauD/TfdA family dioxygenase [Saccharibacter sp. EH60]
MPDTLKAPGLHVTKIGARLGVVVHGINAKEELTDTQCQFLREALRLYKVLFLKRQFLDSDQHEKLASVFGEPILHPTIKAPHGPRYRFDAVANYEAPTDTGHTDVTFIPAYPKVSVLRALEIPPVGGATVWGNTATAYQDLPTALKHFAEVAWGIHSNNCGCNEKRLDAHAQIEEQAFEGKLPCYITRHPVVQVHPETKERNLLLGDFISGLDGFSRRESNVLIELLQRYVTRIDNTVSWHWEEGDVAIWDTRATQHYAPANFESHPRLLRRITVKGDVSMSCDGRPGQALVQPE